MFSPDEYELVDFGRGRKLERFGPYWLDRPSAAAERATCENPDGWQAAHAVFRRTHAESGVWQTAESLPDTWSLTHETVQFELKRTESGQIGVFPEQAENWDWIDRQVRRANRELTLLNLFAYTGGSTLAAARAGARVVHIDAAKNTVQRARGNAQVSGLEEAPIRWITEDAQRFVDRELRRGNHYDGVILDPPSYGHGPQGEIWKLSDHLTGLLEKCGQLTRSRRALILLTCHTPGYGPAELEATLADTVFGHCQAGVRSGRLQLRTASGRRLPSGAYARWPG